MQLPGLTAHHLDKMYLEYKKEIIPKAKHIKEVLIEAKPSMLSVKLIELIISKIQKIVKVIFRLLSNLKLRIFSTFKKILR